MRLQNELWQGYSGYWQNQFIHHHILVLGYTAWRGYLEAGRGMVVCNVVSAVPSSMDWTVDTVTFSQEFMPQGRVNIDLQALELEEETVTALLRAIATYDPTQSIVLLVMGGGAIDINVLQHLKVPPAECYEQVQHRWVEFQPDLTTQSKSI
ncbi:MAG: hypothetical protein WBA57_05580 [Elainellaceae cyanobacterium]